MQPDGNQFQNNFNNGQPQNNVGSQTPIQNQAQNNYVKYTNESIITKYLSELKLLLTNPKSFNSKSNTSLLKAVIFPLINIAIMAIVAFFVTIISVLTNGSKAKISDKLGDGFILELIKSIGLNSLYAAILLALIASIVMIFVLITKKNNQFKDIVTSVSVFSLNFLAVALTSTVGLLTVWVSNSDFSSFVNLLNNIIMSSIFTYTGVIIVIDIIKLTSLSLLKSTLIYVGSIILIVFMLGKMFDASTDYLNVSFGGYSNNSVSQSSGIINSLNDIFNESFEDFYDFNL